MTSRRKPSARPATVTLTRREVEIVLVHHMGWEDIDVASFWRVASKLKATDTDQRGAS
ncbi:MAG: hypothetical protein AB7J30_00410 [Hyphomicrobium sp.]